MTNYTNYTIQQLQAALVELGMSEQQLKKLKTKEAMIKALGKLQPETEDDDISALIKLPETKSPDYPDWTTYVLGLLQDHELKNGNPTVDGLRRVIGIVFGDIVESRTKILEIPNNNYEKCTASHTLVVRKHNDGQIVVVTAAADVRYKTTEAPYNEYLVATADTRAEGKALRRILKLSIITAEEYSAKTEDTINNNELINENQINVIQMLCFRLSINPAKLLAENVSKEIKDVADIPYQTAKVILSNLSYYQRHLNEIPDSIKNYNANWKEEFNANSKSPSK